MYAVMKQNNSDTSGKPTVARHSFRNDSARYMELLLLPILFSSILAAPLNILAFVRVVDDNSKNRSQSDNCAIQVHVAPQLCRFSTTLGIIHDIPEAKKIRLSFVDALESTRSHGDRRAHCRRNRHPSSESVGYNCERGTTCSLRGHCESFLGRDKSAQRAR